MTSKLSKQAILYCTALGAVILIAAVLSRGQYYYNDTYKN